MNQGIWRPAPPASTSAVVALRNKAPLKLPDSYLLQLEDSNGGEGDLAVNPGWIAFWPAEDVITWNAEYEVDKFLPGFFGFGSNGGGELFAFDLRRGDPYPIVMVPFIPIDPRQAVQIANSFDELREFIGTPLKET